MIEFTEEDRRRLDHVITRLQQMPDDNAARDAAFLRQLAERSTGDAEGKRYGSVEEIKRDFFPGLHAEEMAAAKARRDAEPDELSEALAAVEAAYLAARAERDEARSALLKATSEVPRLVSERDEAKEAKAGDAGLREWLTSDEAVDVIARRRYTGRRRGMVYNGVVAAVRGDLEALLDAVPAQHPNPQPEQGEVGHRVEIDSPTDAVGELRAERDVLREADERMAEEGVLDPARWTFDTTQRRRDAGEGDREPGPDKWCCDSCGTLAPAETEGWEQTPTDDAGVTVEWCPFCRPSPAATEQGGGDRG